MNLKYVIKEVKREERELTIAEKCMFFVSKSVGSMSAIAIEELKRVGLVSVNNPHSYTKGTFETTITRPATPEEIVAWNVLNISMLCDSDKIGCRTCPLNLLYDDSDRSCCEVDKRTAKALKILTGKEMVITTE